MCGGDSPPRGVRATYLLAAPCLFLCVTWPLGVACCGSLHPCENKTGEGAEQAMTKAGPLPRERGDQSFMTTGMGHTVAVFWLGAKAWEQVWMR